MNSETFPSLTTTLLPFSERPSTLPVKGLRASEIGASVEVLNSEIFPSLSTTTLLPFSERPSTLPVKGLKAPGTRASLGTEYSYFVPYSFSLTLLPFSGVTVFLTLGCNMN